MAQVVWERSQNIIRKRQVRDQRFRGVETGPGLYAARPWSPLVIRRASQGSAPAKPGEAPPSMARLLSSSKDVFRLDLACILVYLTARVQAITPVAMVRALWQASMLMYALMARL